jgi:hypothetical protein
MVTQPSKCISIASSQVARRIVDADCEDGRAHRPETVTIGVRDRRTSPLRCTTVEMTWRAGGKGSHFDRMRRSIFLGACPPAMNRAMILVRQTWAHADARRRWIRLMNVRGRSDRSFETPSLDGRSLSSIKSSESRRALRPEPSGLSPPHKKVALYCWRPRRSPPIRQYVRLLLSLKMAAAIGDLPPAVRHFHPNLTQGLVAHRLRSRRTMTRSGGGQRNGVLPANSRDLGIEYPIGYVGRQVLKRPGDHQDKSRGPRLLEGRETP